MQAVKESLVGPLLKFRVYYYGSTGRVVCYKDFEAYHTQELEAMANIEMPDNAESFSYSKL